MTVALQCFLVFLAVQVAASFMHWSLRLFVRLSLCCCCCYSFKAVAFSLLFIIIIMNVFVRTYTHTLLRKQPVDYFELIRCIYMHVHVHTYTQISNLNLLKNAIIFSVFLKQCAQTQQSTCISLEMHLFNLCLCPFPSVCLSFAVSTISIYLSYFGFYLFILILPS